MKSLLTNKDVESLGFTSPKSISSFKFVIILKSGFSPLLFSLFPEVLVRQFLETKLSLFAQISSTIGS
jgi:hypothetical protein